MGERMGIVLLIQIYRSLIFHFATATGTIHQNDNLVRNAALPKYFQNSFRNARHEMTRTTLLHASIILLALPRPAC